MVLGVLSGLELLLWWTPVWKGHRWIARILLIPQMLVSLAIFVVQPRLWVAVLVILGLYRAVNLFRVVKDRVQADYLYHTSRRTCCYLIGLQIADLAIASLISHYHAGLLLGLYTLAVGQLLVGLILFLTTIRHLQTTRPPGLGLAHADRDLPGLTVAIPARNETTDLEACLRSLIASDYPKLEILVLDDCSQNGRTPDIIRGFAHDGVRFIAGKEPPSQWLAKNYAYSQLASEASGELLLFCGVDVLFKPDSLRALIETLLHKKQSMLAVIPANELPSSWDLASILVQPARYAWELALPRRLLRQPPVLSTCWLISRQALESAGGFASISRKAIPEAYLALQTAMSKDGYSFLQSSSIIGISSHKSFEDQLATAVRTRYPQLHRRPELVALTSLAEFSVLVWPLAVLAVTLLSQLWLLAALSGLAYLLEVITYSKVVNLTYHKVLFGGLLLLPVAALYDIGILNYSMWQYEFREVIWKGRNVCIPIMRVMPGLPKTG